MNPSIRRGWVSALKGPFYPQGKDRLRSRDGHYCPFGVLCNMLHPDRWILMGHHGYLDSSGEICWAVAPPGVLAEAGIRGEAEDAIVLMVDEGASFEEIADWIEENL